MAHMARWSRGTHGALEPRERCDGLPYLWTTLIGEPDGCPNPSQLALSGLHNCEPRPRTVVVQCGLEMTETGATGRLVSRRPLALHPNLVIRRPSGFQKLVHPRPPRELLDNNHAARREGRRPQKAENGHQLGLRSVPLHPP